MRAELSEAVKDNAKLQGKLELLADNQAKADKTIESQSNKVAELTAMVAGLKAANKTAEKPAGAKTTKKPTAKAEWALKNTIYSYRRILYIVLMPFDWLF